LSSAKPICVEFYRRTSPITIVGDHTARWAKQLHAARRCLSRSKHVERSLRHQCSAGYTISTGRLHDKFLHPTAIRTVDDPAETYLPRLRGIEYGEASIRNLLNMASGVKFSEDCGGKDDEVPRT
jgi:hypothetical protein